MSDENRLLKHAELRAYKPTMRDQIATWLMGDDRSSPARNRLIEGVMGSRGLGNTGMGLVDLTPAGAPLWTQEYKSAETPSEAISAALNFIPGAKGGKAVAGKLSAEAQRLREEIAEALRSGEHRYYGLRVTEDPLEIGKAAPASRHWVDGNPTDEMLDGPSVYEIRREEDIDRALAAAGFSTGHRPAAGYYYGPHVSLIGSDKAQAGEDAGEMIFGGGGNVLRSWLKSFGPGAEK
jgi:hypothetical protein